MMLNFQKKKKLIILLAVFFTLFSFISFSKEEVLTFKAYVDSLIPDKVSAHSSLWPSGRSPERFHTDFKNPRVVINFPASELESRQFFAYTKNLNLVQAIIWNEQLGEFDFLLDQDYKGVGKPNLKKVDHREKCLSCHRGGGPIMTAENEIWSEMNEADTAFGDPNVGEKIKTANSGSETYEGFPFLTSGVPLRDSVERANRFFQSVRACRSICSSSLSCKKALIKRAITNPSKPDYMNRSFLVRQFSLGSDSSRVQESDLPDELVEFVEKNWPEDGFSYESWKLKDKFKNQHDLFNFHLAHSDSLENAHQESLLGDLSPTKPRPKIGKIDRSEAVDYLMDVAFMCLGFLESDTKVLRSLPVDRIDVALRDTELNLLLENKWPILRDELMPAIINSFKKEENFSGSVGCENPTMTTTLDTENQNLLDDTITMIDVETRRPVSAYHFQVACRDCHSTGGFAPVFPFEGESEFESYVLERRETFIHMLEGKQMPPYGGISEELRKDMILWIRSLEKPN